jgi:hypothetical protein
MRILPVLALTACVSATTPGPSDMAPDLASGIDPQLIGSWKSTNGLAWMFAADQSWHGTQTSSDTQSGCTTVGAQTGTWSANGMLLTLVAASGTLAVNGCSNAASNHPAQPDPTLDTSPHTWSYSIIGGTMNATSMYAVVPTVFTRQ